MTAAQVYLIQQMWRQMDAVFATLEAADLACGQEVYSKLKKGEPGGGGLISVTGKPFFFFHLHFSIYDLKRNTRETFFDHHYLINPDLVHCITGRDGQPVWTIKDVYKSVFELLDYQAVEKDIMNMLNRMLEHFGFPTIKNMSEMLKSIDSKKLTEKPLVN